MYKTFNLYSALFYCRFQHLDDDNSDITQLINNRFINKKEIKEQVLAGIEMALVEAFVESVEDEEISDELRFKFKNDYSGDLLTEEPFLSKCGNKGKVLLVECVYRTEYEINAAKCRNEKNISIIKIAKETTKNIINNFRETLIVTDAIAVVELRKEKSPSMFKRFFNKLLK